MAVADLRAWLAAQGWAAPSVPAEHGRVAPAVVLGLHAARRRGFTAMQGAGGESEHDDGHHDDDIADDHRIDEDAAAAGHVPAMRGGWARPAAAGQRYVAATRHFDAPVDVAALGAALAAEGVLRAKGVLLGASGQWLELQLVGRRVDVRPARRAPAPGDRPSTDGAAGCLVTIMLRQR
jgi:G3E family GTPase